MEDILPQLDPQMKGALDDISKEFEVGRLSLTDVGNMYAPGVMKIISDFKWDEYFVRLREGDSTAIGVMAFSLIVGGWFAKKFITVAFPADEAPASIKDPSAEDKEDEKEEIVLRDFTVDQLRENDGSNGKPIYIALKREVFDVSGAPEFYGEGCSYHCFAGREASRAMAKMSFDEEELSNMNITDLGPFDRNILGDWYEKFKYYKCYPVVGKVSVPPSELSLSLEELSKYDGKQDVPEDRVDAPIYIAIKGDILDVSYGGKDFYSGECGYAVMAGKNASRALGKMSLSMEDVDNQDISDLTAEELAVLDDWHSKLGKKYPCVGKLTESSSNTTATTRATDPVEKSAPASAKKAAQGKKGKK